MKSVFKNLAVVISCVLFSLAGYSQTDTLHLNYHHTQIKPHDTTVAKIDKWAKGLTGKHVDIRVIAYYHKLEFKKFSDQRLEELFLVLNRKARSVITIVEQDSKKGKDYQRTMVDIIYTPTLSEADKKAKEAAEKAEAAKVAEAKKAANADKAAKSKEEKAAKESAKAETGDKKSKDKKSESSDKDVAKEEGDGKGDGKGEGKGDGKEEKGGKKEKDDVDKDVSYSTIVSFNEGGAMELKEIEYIKRAKFIVAQTGKSRMDENLVKTVKDWWKFNADVTAMPYEEAQKLCKESKKDTIVILSVAQVKTWFPVKTFGYSYKVLKLGRALALENSKGKIIYKHFVPIDPEEGVNLTSLIFGVSSMNYMFDYMLTNKIRSSSSIPFLIDENSKELKDKTLVIAESMKHPKLPLEEVPSTYTSKIAWVSDQKAEDVILKRKDEAYVMPVKLPSPTGNYIYYVMNGATGKVYIFDEGPSFQLSYNPTSMGKTNDPSQSGYVDKANLKRFEEIMNDEDLQKKRAERAAKERGKTESKEKDQAAKKEKENAKKEAKEKSSKDKGKEKSDESASESKDASVEKEAKEEKSSKKEKKSKKSDEEKKDASAVDSKDAPVEKEIKEEVKEEKSKKKDKKSKKSDEEKKEETKSE